MRANARLKGVSRLNRYERTRVLVEGSADLAQEIASEIEDVCAVEVLDEPREELVMVKVREGARGSLFYLGEALMCSCRVRIADAQGGGEPREVVGFGYVMGSRRNAAYNLALIDAAFSAGWKLARKEKWERKIEREAVRLRERAAKEHALTELTRVNFSTMDGDSRVGGSAEEKARRTEEPAPCAPAAHGGAECGAAACETTACEAEVCEADASEAAKRPAEAEGGSR